MKPKLFFAAIAFISSHSLWAQDLSPSGLWTSFDDDNGKPSSSIRIVEKDGEYMGRIEKLFLRPGEDANPKCVKCEGPLKNQPILGMIILYGMKRDGSEFSGGKIIDPDSGQIYKSTLNLLNNGKKLDVRGYVGVPMFGRTQTWVREE